MCSIAQSTEFWLYFILVAAGGPRYGIYHYKSFTAVGEAAEQVNIYRVASNRDEGMEYRIELLPDEGEQFLVQDFTENKEFTVPLNERGICTVTARTIGEPQGEQILQIYYY